MTDEPATIHELEENVLFLRDKSRAVGLLLDSLMEFKPNVEKYDLDATKFNTFLDHLAWSLLNNETERQVLEKDLQREKFLTGKVFLQ